MAKTHRHTIQDGRDMPIQIDTAIIDRYAELIGVYGIAVYVALARFARRENTTILAYQTIADVLGVARSTAQNTIKKLVDAGLITSVQQTDDAGNPIASNRYTLLPIKHSNAEHDGGGYRVAVGGVPSNGRGVPPRGTSIPSDGTSVPPNSYIDSISKNHDHESVIPPPSPTRASEKSDGDGDGRTLAFLIDRGVGAAQEFAQLPFDPMRLDYEARMADGQTKAIIVKAWRLQPPTETYHYERRRDDAPDRPRRSERGKHNGTGGHDLKNPGWMEREFKKLGIEDPSL